METPARGCGSGSVTQRALTAKFRRFFRSTYTFGAAEAPVRGDVAAAPRAREVEGDVDEHVLLAADHAAASGFFEQMCARRCHSGRRRPRRDAGSWSTPRHSPASAFPGRRAPAGPAAGAPDRRRHPPAHAGRSRGASPSESAAATNTSSGALPAPAPIPASEASTRVAPCSTATIEFATPSDRLWWAWIPISVAGKQLLTKRIDAFGDVAHEHARRRSRRHRRKWHRSPPSSLACPARRRGVVMWLIIRKPTASMPSSRAAAMCSAEMSASVQWVATRTTVAPGRGGRLRGCGRCRCRAAAAWRPWRA